MTAGGRPGGHDRGISCCRRDAALHGRYWAAGRNCATGDQDAQSVGLARLTECARTSMAGRFDLFPIGKERNEDSMLTTFMKWIASAALLGGLVLLAFPGVYARGYQAGLLILIPAAATVVIFSGRFPRRVSLGRCLWCGGLPVQPGCAAWVLGSAQPRREHARAYFVRTLSLKLLKTPPRLSIASITDRMPGSESL
jgi:hypothetical protein